VVVRCQGGANAGHTVVVGGRKTVLHLLPSGVLHAGARCVIGNGVVLDPIALCQELDELAAGGCEAAPRLMISDRAHLVLPAHKALDAAIEAAKGAAKVGTTLRGIGPCYVDKVARSGLRAGELKDRAGFERKVRDLVSAINRQIVQLYGGTPIEVEQALGLLLPACQRIAPLVGDTAAFLHEQARNASRFLFEGAQGVLLDIDYGTYPFVTSSNTGIGGVITGSGLSHKQFDEVIGVVKAYSTRVGSGPFAVELTDARGEALRQRGREFGATTGRPRRCGWLDLVAVGFACRLNGVDRLALTKLDILTGEPEVPLCVGYELDGERLDTIPARIDELARVQPVWEVLPGWTQPLAACRRLAELPAPARRYIEAIEVRVGVPVGWVGVGPGRDEIIVA
jgi:adenylosuccinate synthase